MLKLSLSFNRFGALAAALLVGLSAQVSADTIVYSNNGPPGDLATSGNTDIGTTDWLYANVRNGGAAGIRTDFARSGNGSAYLEKVGSPAAAEVTYWPGSPIGALDDLIDLSYDWFRSSLSTGISAKGAPSLGLYVSNGAGSAGWLIYEHAETMANPWTAPIDEWQTTDTLLIEPDGSTGNGQFWSRIFGSTRTYLTLADWKTQLAGYDVLGFSAFVGSGGSAGTFIGAVDNISWQFDGSDAVTYNFEVVPEPSSVLMGVIAGGLGLAAAARRRFNRA